MLKPWRQVSYRFLYWSAPRFVSQALNKLGVSAIGRSRSLVFPSLEIELLLISVLGRVLLELGIKCSEQVLIFILMGFVLYTRVRPSLNDECLEQSMIPVLVGLESYAKALPECRN